ncbi:hypothetical protein NPJ88_006470 [Halomonas elongata]|uniref:hypothetical protein n=1 Tax=Halomonas elongata TaxID=2746 RepID=UPI00255B34D8|nr:hypothetical protein [Halomonas elongata]MDL4861970.1 hypothetical protein [Halomonas elongata]
MGMNSWRSWQVIPIEYIALLLAGIDPLEVDESRVRMKPPIKQPGTFRAGVMALANEKELPGASQAKQWYQRIKQALIDGEIHPAGEIRQWNAREGTWRSVDREGLMVMHGFEFDMTRPDVARWLVSLGWAESELPDFLSGIALTPTVSKADGGEELRALEALGLLAEMVAKQAPKYQRNGKTNKAQIAEVMSQQAGETPGMSKSKLQRLLSDALDAWEEKRG